MTNNTYSVRHKRASLIIFLIAFNMQFIVLALGRSNIFWIDSTGRGLTGFEFMASALYFLSGVLKFIEKGGMKQIPKEFRQWCRWILLFFSFMIVWGIVINRNISWIIFDLRFMCLFGIIFVALDRNNWPIIERNMLVQFIIGLPIFIAGIYNLDMTSRQFFYAYQGDIAFGYRSQLLYAAPYFIISAPARKGWRLIIIYIAMAFYLSLFLFSQGRGNFVATVLVLFCLWWSYFRYNKNILWLKSTLRFCLLLICACTLFYGYVHVSKSSINVAMGFDAFSKRTGAQYGIAKKIEEGARIGETNEFFRKCSTLDFFIGRGVGGAFDVTDTFGWLYGWSEKNALHIGYITPILKGGFLFAVVWWWGYLKLAFLGLRRKADCYTFSAYCVLLIYLAKFTYSGSLEIGLSMVLFFIVTGKAMSMFSPDSQKYGLRNRIE